MNEFCLLPHSGEIAVPKQPPLRWMMEICRSCISDTQDGCRLGCWDGLRWAVLSSCGVGGWWMSPSLGFTCAWAGPSARGRPISRTQNLYPTSGTLHQFNYGIARRGLQNGHCFIRTKQAPQPHLSLSLSLSLSLPLLFFSPYKQKLTHH